MNKENGLEYSIMLGLLTIMLLGVNQGFSQTNDTQFTTYQNEELGISFQYPSNWSEMDKNTRKQVTEMLTKLASGQNVTVNEKVYAETAAVADFRSQDFLLGVSLIKYEFPDSISVQEFNEIALKLTTTLLGFEPTLIENINITISDEEANKATIRMNEGPLMGESTSIAFFKGNEVTNLQLGASNNPEQASIINRIIDSIRIVK